MKKWLTLFLVTIAVTSVLTATTIKVAVLPLKRLDSSSKYIQKFLTIRDLEHTFNTNDKYELLNLKTTADAFKDMDIADIDDMEKDDMSAIGKELNADVVILGVISAVNEQTFSIQFRFYSMKTQDLKQQKVDVVKSKKKRWAVLEKDFLGKLASFINDETDKMLTLAIQDYHAENFKQAEQGFNTILNYNPDYKPAYYYLGMIAYKQKKYDAAITNLNKSLADTLTTKDVITLQSLSSAYGDKGDNINKISTLVKVANLQNDEELWLSIANMYVENNQKDKAEEALLNAIKIDPKFMKAQTRMAFLLYDNGKYSEAIPYLEKAATENPDNDTIARRLAFSYQKAGRIGEAIARYEGLLKTSPNNTNAYLNLAGLYRAAAADASEKNNQALVTEYNMKSLETLNKLKAIDAENAIMYLRFADVYLSLNNLKDAESNANSALAKDASLYQPYIILATINQRRGSDKYNEFIVLEKEASKAYGGKADRLSKERDAARIAANAAFRKAEEQLKAVKSRSSEPEVISDVDSKLSNLAQLIAQSGKAY